MASSDVLSGTFAGRYTIERELGSGATATVYLARDTQRGIAVAVKLLRPELAQSVGADRFLREIRLNEKLHHPHIVPVLDSGEQDGRLYFVLPHMEEGSLRQLLQREKQLPIETAISIARTIAQALDYAHQQNLIHRDVKPENILFTSGQACLADFGIARAVERAMDESTTDTGMVRGTPAYMSPEQASGSRQYDGRSDQYSLACVLYEMLAGVPAFIGPTPEAVIAQRFQHSPRELHVYRPTVSASLDAVITRALAMSPADRYASAAEFAKALSTDSATQSVDRRANTTQPLRRRRAIAGAAGTAAFLFVALWLFQRDAVSAFLSNSPDLNPNKYVVLPVESADRASARLAHAGLVKAFGTWTDLDLASDFEIRDARSSGDSIVSDREAQRLAARVGAGKYVRARLDAGRLSLVTGDTESGTTASATGDFPSAGSSQDRGYDALVSQLLFGRRDAATLGSVSARAVRAYLAAAEAREAFNLPQADSLLLIALEADRQFARAALSLAQVRVWKEEPARAWKSWAERAAADPGLQGDERMIAAGLVALANEDYSTACAQFRSLTQSHPRAFDSWYGLASCLRRDRLVIRDPRSPSGFRFRSSYRQAIIAYVRAFDLAPVLHRNFQPGAYGQLRRLLFADHVLLREGVSVAAGPTEFYASPTWRGDTLVFIPYPRSVAPAPPADAPLRQLAVVRQQQLFARVAQSWAAALPNNASVKEAVAISLEMLGDRNALDTLRAARAIASDRDLLVRLAAEEVFMRLSFGRTDSRHIAVAETLGDSLLRAHPTPSRAIARILVPVGAALGRCHTAGALAVRASDPRTGEALSVAASTVASADSLTVVAAMGCDRSRDSSAIAAIEASIRTRVRDSLAADHKVYQLLPLALRQGTSLDSNRLHRYARASGDEVLRMRLHLLNGRRDSVLFFLQNRARALGPHGTIHRSPDAAHAEALLWIAVGHVHNAREWLDPVLNSDSWFQLMTDRPVGAASLMRSAALRAAIAANQNEPAAQKWAHFIGAAWRRADADVLAKAQSPARSQ